MLMRRNSIFSKALTGLELSFPRGKFLLAGRVDIGYGTHVKYGKQKKEGWNPSHFAGCLRFSKEGYITYGYSLQQMNTGSDSKYETADTDSDLLVSSRTGRTSTTTRNHDTSQFDVA
jgi:hypothetical protein